MIAGMFRRARLGIRLTLLFLLALALLSPEWPAFGDPGYRLNTLIAPETRFDFVGWTTQALLDKLRGIRDGRGDDPAAKANKELVLTFLDQLGQAQVLEGDIERVYADPTVADPAAATAEMQAEVDALRADLRARQPRAEALVQQQVAVLLREEGLTVGGQIWPPVFMKMTPTPYMLIVSPRDRIAQVNYASLVPGLSTADKEALEQAVFNQLNLSALVVPIGGLGTYPAMIAESDSIYWLTGTTAHEWTHHWLSFHQLGVRYLASPEMRMINETVASLVEREVGPEVMARFYPITGVRMRFIPLSSVPLYNRASLNAPSPLQPFDFSAELSATRVTVDALLMVGKVAEAEAYMEARRQVFVSHGYAIRKLNQAFFAFYGGYAAEPGGAAGANPIGPMLRDLRAASPSLRDFLVEVAGVTSYDDFVALHERIVGAAVGDAP